MGLHTTTTVSLLALALSARAHFLTTNVTVNGVSYAGITDAPWDIPPLMASSQPRRTFPYEHFVSFPMDYQYTAEGTQTQFQNPDIICGVNSTAGQAYIPIAAGDALTFQWTRIGHQGSVATYLANCHGPCNVADKLALKFFKIDESGYLNTSMNPELIEAWAAGVAVSNDGQWTSAIPADIVAGHYIVRHEIISLQVQTPQFYPWCWNLKVSGAGTQSPDGVVGTELYHRGDIKIVGTQLTDKEKEDFEYVIPGPNMYKGATTVKQEHVTATAVSVGIPY